MTTAQQFSLSVSGVPTQADYYTFESSGGVTFAVWFDVDANGTAPTGASYVAATNQIEVDILSTDTEDQIVSKLSAILLGDVSFLTSFSGSQAEGANFEDALEGDLLTAIGMPATWDNGNTAKVAGDGRIAGFPVIAVNSVSRYVDVVNPFGVAMTNTAVDTGTVVLTPTPIIEWRTSHYARPKINQLVKVGTTVTASILNEHRLNVGDTFTVDDNGLAQTATVTTVIDTNTFTFTDTSGQPDATYNNGSIIAAGATVTRYRVESLGFNNLYRLNAVSGDLPRFVDHGVAVDDFITISGGTFNSLNTGTFRVLAVDDSSVIYQNETAVPELHTFIGFNNLDTEVVWTANFDEVTGAAGSFLNLSIGDWVKKIEDADDNFVQVIDFLDAGDASTTAALAVKIKLGQNYPGVSATTRGVYYDQNSAVRTGVFLDDVDDIRFFEGDSVKVEDSLFVDSIADDDWFSTANSGTFTIQEYGTDATTGSPFVRIVNAGGQNQTNRRISVSEQGYFIIEGANNLYKSVRVIEHTAIDTFNADRRVIYMTPDSKLDRISQTNGTKIVPIGKMGYPSDVTTGIDGYSYYTGLLRTVQREIDGFEPEAITFPGRRAVGGQIEILPPLINRIQITLEVTTNEGVNLNEISNDIKTAVIDYITGLGVGEDVILSEVIVSVMSITGVAAVTFTNPTPDTERVAIADNERAFITPDDISVS